MMQVLAIGECMIEMSGGQDNVWRMGFAGDTLNTLWYARAGLDPVDGPIGYFTALGDDPFSDRVLAFLHENGIEAGLIRRIAGRHPGLYLIEQIAGDRHFTYWRDTSAARQLADDEAALREAIGGARLVYFSGITLAILSPEARTRLLALSKSARDAGTIVAFDPNIRPPLWESPDAMREAVTAAAGVSTMVLPSFDDERRIFGDETPQVTARRYQEAGAAEVIIKNGSAPVLVSRRGAAAEVSVSRVAEVLDPTAAGDSFNGAYLASRARGADPAAAAAEGVALAARVIGVHGALVSTPPMQRWQRSTDGRGDTTDRGSAPDP